MTEQPPTVRQVGSPRSDLTVDSAVSAVFATFPGQTWRDATLREVIEAALEVPVTTVVMDRCRYCRQMWPADLIDEESDACPMCEIANPHDGG